MLVPIQYALTFPSRKPLAIPRLDLASLGSLTFERPDVNRFPCLRMAYEALEAGGSAGAVLNAANEVAVAAFLGGTLSFTGIAEVIARTVDHMEYVAHPSLDTIVAIDAESRRVAADIITHRQIA
jgi:1-deoxy-D-xylulose-5-phosphate reductoisomerase